MKKMGFSLAEVLITLAIIGVVAALAIPQFTAEVYNQTNASKLAPIVADYENVFGLMLLKEDRENISETEFGGTIGGTIQAFRTQLERYTKVSKVDTPANCGCTSISEINGNAPFSPSGNAVLTPGGAVLMFNRSGNNTTVLIDVNGSTQPNRLGRDVFAFVLADDDGHLYPYGSRQASQILYNSTTNTWDNSSANNDTRCTGSEYNGRGCTARLIENNYKVDY